MSGSSDKAALAYPKEIPKDYPGDYIRSDYKGSDKLKDHVAIITGGDSGIGKAVSLLFVRIGQPSSSDVEPITHTIILQAREGAKVTVVYHSNEEGAKEVKEMIEKEGSECLLCKKDLGQKKDCQETVDETLAQWGRLDIVVNNAGVQFPKFSVLDIDEDQLDMTFRTNIYSMFFMTQAALPHLLQSPNPSIINNTSINAWRGHEHLIDYTSTKGAIVGFTRSMAQNLAKEGVRVNMVAPGPVWTPIISKTFSDEMMEGFGQDVPLGRAGQPEELAPSFVFLASRESSYITGQVIHVNGGHPY